jgi:spore coat protein U-like protein
MKSFSFAAAILAGTAILAASPAFAVGSNTVGDPIGVSLTVNDECTIQTDNLAFGSTGIVEGDITTSADITIECTKHTPYAIALSAGGSGDDSDRTMSNTTNPLFTDPLHYQLYRDSGHNQLWGSDIGTNTADSATVVGVTGGATGADEVHTINALVPAHQNVPIGTYNDTITATIWYADGVTP